MKKMRRFISFMLAMVMVLAMSMSAMAATVTVDIDIADDEVLNNHTFVAYQIFAGTQTGEDGDKALGDITWGTGINASDLMSALVADNSPLKDEFSGIAYSTGDELAAAAKKVAEKMATWATTSGNAENFAEIAYNYKNDFGTKITTPTASLEEGYYLIVDTTTFDENAESNAYNAALLQVTGDKITIGVKTDVPSVEKKVKENKDYTGNNRITGFTDKNYGVGYNDIADYSIGDTVPFAFYSKVPDMTYYDTYKYVFHDQLSSGLTLDASSIVVKIGNTTLAADSQYTVRTNGLSDSCTFEIEIANLKQIAAATKDALLQIDYNATLNSNAEIGEATENKNTVFLEYSNNPNDLSSTGKTPQDTVVVFSYELDVTKVDGAEKSAEGAYTKMLKDAEFVLYRVNSSDVNEYVKIANDGTISWTINKSDAKVLTSDDNGNFTVKGLDAGTYYLEETKAPTGYNLLTSPIEIVIAATMQVDRQNYTTSTDALTKLEMTVDTDINDTTNGKKTVDGTKSGENYTGEVSVTVENNKGAILPSTGGVGTTMFYVIGGALVLVAVVLLVTRKRMSVKK